MRLFRTILGMLLLTLGLPALLIGAGLWTTMQHRDAGGAFTGRLQTIATPGYAVVVNDLDQLLRADAPFVRTGSTRLRLGAQTSAGPAFIGIAPAGDVARYLANVPHTRVDAVDIGTGALPVRASRAPGGDVAAQPGQQGFWVRSGTGTLDFKPAELSGRAYSLVIMNSSAQPGIRLQAIAEVRPGWLNSATWGLLTLGSMLIIGGMMVLAWPGRRREVVYVVEPSQVPELASRLGAPLPIAGAPTQPGGHRPRTLADANTAGSTWSQPNPPAVPQLTWPPNQTGSTTAADTPAKPTPIEAGATAIWSAPQASAPVAASQQGPAAVTAQPSATATADSGPAVAQQGGDGSTAQTSVGVVATDDTAERKTAAEPVALPAQKPTDDPVVASTGAVTASGAATPSIDGRPVGEVGRRRASQRSVGERQVFEASAVEAWVAETAAARVRDVEARAAAIRGADARATVPGGAEPEVTGPDPADAAASGSGAARPVTGPGASAPKQTPAKPAPVDEPLEPVLTKTAAAKPAPVDEGKPFEPVLSKAAAKSGLAAVRAAVAEQAALDAAQSERETEVPATRTAATRTAATRTAATRTPATRTPAAERRRSRRASESTVPSGSSAGASSPPADPTGALASGSAATDGGVPAARSVTEEPAVVKAEAAAGAAKTGRRRKAEVEADSTGKAPKPTRRAPASRTAAKE